MKSTMNKAQRAYMVAKAQSVEITLITGKISFIVVYLP